MFPCFISILFPASASLCANYDLMGFEVLDSSHHRFCHKPPVEDFPKTRALQAGNQPKTRQLVFSPCGRLFWESSSKDLSPQSIFHKLKEVEELRSRTLFISKLDQYAFQSSKKKGFFKESLCLLTPTTSALDRFPWPKRNWNGAILWSCFWFFYPLTVSSDDIIHDFF